MLTYNTQLKKLILPEYGRHIQSMVDHCLSIDDRMTRTDCAYSIVETMYRLFPPTGDPEEYRRKLWDHLAIMSDFALDIDWPYEVIMPESLNTAPDPMPIPTQYIANRQLGRNIEIMVEQAANMPESDARDEVVLMIANHIKKILSSTANEVVEDAKVFKILRNMSHGLFNINADQVHLHEFKTLPQPKKKKKK